MPLHNSAPHTFQKNGIFYFNRRVPEVLRRHYTSPRISYSLRTRSPSVAASRANRAAGQLDEYWFHLRSQDVELPGQHLLRMQRQHQLNQIRPQRDVKAANLSMSGGVEVYLRLKGSGKGKSFIRAAQRSCGYVIDVCGDKPLQAYSKSDANAFRDALVERGMAGSSITRIFGTVRSVTNFAASEEGIDFTNPFGNVYFDRSAGVEERQPIPIKSIRKVQEECVKADDDIRWLVALISDTGMRLAEATGLLCEDFKCDDSGNLSVLVRPHPWRRLKTKGSERKIPLVGASLWAAKRILEVHSGAGFAFPRYNKTDQTNANTASASLNKWLRLYLPEGFTMHGFRHSLRDRLRAVECPSDVVDQIGGWQAEGVGQAYGAGYPIRILRKWMNEVADCKQAS
jgi:integrase